MTDLLVLAAVAALIVYSAFTYAIVHLKSGAPWQAAFTCREATSGYLDQLDGRYALRVFAPITVPMAWLPYAAKTRLLPAWERLLGWKEPG